MYNSIVEDGGQQRTTNSGQWKVRWTLEASSRSQSAARRRSPAYPFLLGRLSIALQ